MGQVTVPDMDEDALRAAYEVISDGIWDWNANTGYVYRNPGWYIMLGYDPHSFKNTVFTWENLIHPDDFKDVMRHFDDYINRASNEYKIQYRIQTKSGDYIWIEDRAQAAKWNDDGSIARMIGAHRNIHAERLLIEEYQKKNKDLEDLVNERTKELLKVNHQLEAKISEAKLLARTDPLTGLYNRRYFEECLTHEMVRAKRFNEPLSLMVIDLDNFKAVNDDKGHLTGDLILVALGKIIKDNVRDSDVACRWGGDEIMILLPHTKLEDGRSVADKVRLIIAEKPLLENIVVTISAGITEYEVGESMQAFINRADQGLYNSKLIGRNTVSCH